MASNIVTKSNVLNSWKEIANYLGRGVRTVQRWERDLGLPVRRPRARSRSAVVAISDEIDVWLRSAPTSEVVPNHSNPAPNLLKLRETMEEHANLRDRCNELRAANNEALAKLLVNLKAMHESVAQSRRQEHPTGD